MSLPPGKNLISEAVSPGGVRIVILGAGALGSVIGAFLSRADADVVLIGRPPHVKRIQQRGLRVKGLQTFTARVEATTDAASVDSADLLILTTKTYDSRSALNAVEFDVGMAASLQNGVLKDEVLARRFGRDKVLGAVTGVGASMVEPGVVAYTFDGTTVFGELDGGVSPRVLRVLEAFGDAGLRAEASERILDDEWSKLCQYCAASLVSALSRLRYHEVCTSRPLAELFVTISREVALVARGLGRQLRDVAGFRVEEVLSGSFAEAVESVMGRGKVLVEAGMTDVKISMLQDLEAGRRTELEDTVGHVVREADRLGLETPALSFGYQVVKGVEASRGLD
jgi:2-dehydropantoate 2-reductase